MDLHYWYNYIILGYFSLFLFFFFYLEKTQKNKNKKT